MHVFRKAFEIINETWAPKLLRYDLLVLLQKAGPRPTSSHTKAYGSTANFRQTCDYASSPELFKCEVRYPAELYTHTSCSPGCAREVWQELGGSGLTTVGGKVTHCNEGPVRSQYNYPAVHMKEHDRIHWAFCWEWPSAETWTLLYQQTGFRRIVSRYSDLVLKSVYAWYSRKLWP
jgi:hypothetical protein